MSNSVRRALFLLAFAILVVSGVMWFVRNGDYNKSEAKSSMFDKKFRTYFVETSGNDTNPGTKELPKLTFSGAMESSTDGDTILIGPGDFNDKLNINKRLVIIGAGSSEEGTVINSNTPDSGAVINVNVSGESKKRVSVSNVRIMIQGENNKVFSTQDH